jgi:hypothetical protein
MQGITDDDARKLEELDRLLNDPDVPLQPALIWHLLDEVSGQRRRGELAVGDRPGAGPEVSPGIRGQSIGC